MHKKLLAGLLAGTMAVAAIGFSACDFGGGGGAVVAEGLEYTLNEDEASYSVTGIGTCTASKIIIGDTHESLPVTGIGYRAFENATDQLTSVALPNTVTSIADQAFNNCYKITSVTLSDTLTSIGNDAFSGCSKLANIKLPDTLTHIGYRAFYDCNRLTKIVIPDSVTSIEMQTFERCSDLSNVTLPDYLTSIGFEAFKESGLTAITLPNSLTSIGQQAFSECSKLTKITIPRSVTSIGERAFEYCRGLAEIKVEVGNTDYHSAGNCLIETASKTLLRGCNNSTIPADGSVTSIAYAALSECGGLTSITIPKSITEIGSWAFSSCGNLTSIRYLGTVDEWKEVAKGSNWCTSDKTIQCSNGKLDRDGNAVA